MPQLLQQSILWAQRFMVAVTGQIGVSLAHMGVALVLLSGVPAAEFGQYAFLQVILAFGFGLSNAALVSPLTVMLNREAKTQQGLISSYLGANLVLCAGTGLLMVLLATLMENSWGTSFWFGVAAMLMWWRWFARGVMLAEHRKATVLTSDAAYTLTLVSLTALAWYLEWFGVTEFLLLQSVAGLVGLLLLEDRFWHAQWAARRFTWAPFLDGFRRHARYSLVGVSTTEATVNSQAYIITALLGPAAFAPVAAANLIFRPVPLVILALTQAERPALAKSLQQKNWQAVKHLTRFMALALGLCLVGNVVLAALVVGWAAPWVLHEPLPAGVLELATVLVGLRVAISCWRGPASALLQADGQFKILADATMVSAMVTVPLVLLAASWGGVMWALAAAAIGEGVATGLTVWYARIRMKV